MSGPRRIDGEKSWFIDWVEQYSQFFERCNWYTYNLAHIEFENDVSMGAWDVTFIVFGLGFRARWNHTRTVRVEEIERRMRSVLPGGGEGADIEVVPEAVSELRDFMERIERQGGRGDE